MKKRGYIYETKNLINGKIYIGKKTGQFAPWYLGSGIALINAIKKYGNKNFRVRILKYANNNKLNMLEKNYIAKYRKKFGKRFLYNISDGGDGGCLVRMFGKDNPMYGKHIFSVERIKKRCPICGKKFIVRITESKKYCCVFCGRKNRIHVYNKRTNKSKLISKELLKEYLDNGWIKGRGEEIRNELSRNRIGSKNPMFGKGYLKIGEKNWMTGRTGKLCPSYGLKRTEEAKQKNREAHLGKTPWNKGLTKYTDKRVLKYTRSRLNTLENKR